MSAPARQWGANVIPTSQVMNENRLEFLTGDPSSPAAKFALQTQSVAFPGDGSTDHKDRIFSIGLFNLGSDGNLIDSQRPGAKLVFECEYTPSATALTVTGATNTTPIRLTVSDDVSSVVNGELVYNDNIGGNTAANGYFKVKNKATVRGTADISSASLYGGGGTLNGLTLILNDGGGSSTLNLNGATNTASKAAFLAAVAVQWPNLTATDAADAVGHNLLLQNLVAATTTVGAGTANTALGLTAGPYSNKSFELWNWVIGSSDTPSVGNAAYTSGGESVYRLTMEWYIALKQPGSNTETRPIGGTFNAAGTWNSVVGAYGAFAVRDTGNTRNLMAIADGTSDALITLGETGKSVSFTSDAKIDYTAGAASEIKTTAGALTLDGNGGVTFEKGNVAVADAGVTDANAVTLRAGKSLVGAAGAGAVTLGSMTGAMTLPTGDVTWTGATDKSISATAAGTGTVALQTATGAINIGTANGAKTVTINTGGTGARTTIVGDNSISNSVTYVRGQAGGLFLTAAFGTVNICGSSESRGMAWTEASSTQMTLGVRGTTTDLLISTTKLGFYGVGPVVQATGGENVTNNVTNSGSTAGTIPDITDGTTYANDYVNLRRALYQLARMLKQDHDQLRALGILT